MSKTTWRLAEGKTWRGKLKEEHPNHGKLVPIPPRWRRKFGSGKMLIPRPLEVDAVVRRVRKGKLATQSLVRAELARRAGADAACPLTTGIFLRIVAEAAEENRRAGKTRVTPYWRVIKDDGRLNDKFPGGAKAQAALLRSEGFTVRPGRGKQPPRVEGFDGLLAQL